ncbi:hypothetical protein [Desulfitobacterium sp.]|uniref:hypothetical protein n=1 Tax=Desulfitobacterium sp. TaxID=49981 RepID=UPI002B20024F|nr:hypothetical protein [Desulfitobacterium sp.]MEA4900702.1 hypothetical protein [Desulfitobacterium sp.]
MASDNIKFLENFIGRDWLNAEFDKINTKSPLKGAGIDFASYHPWVHFMYEIEYLLRRSDVENREDVIMGRYHYILNNAGMLLKDNFNYIVDKKDAQMKLRSPEQFYDFIWELEVRTMLSRRGACADFVDPKSGNTYDGIAIILDHSIPYECKNKIIDNNQYNNNSVFSQILANKLGDIPSVQNKIIQIEFENGRLEDIKTIVAIVRDKFDIFNYQSILGRYKIRTLKLPIDTPPQYLINREGINQIFQVNERRKSELYLDKAPSDVVKTKILIKMPEQVFKLHNLNGVLKKANAQLSTGGIVFLQVPYSTFESAKTEVAKELSQCFSNISAVKLIALGIEFYENKGVKISRSEDLIVSPRGKIALLPKEIEFLSQPMAFSKYAWKS